MNSYLSTPDCSISSTIKVFRVMIDELKEELEEWDYEFLRDNVVQIREKDIREGKFKRDNFLKLMDYYLKTKSCKSESRKILGIGPLTQEETLKLGMRR